MSASNRGITHSYSGKSRGAGKHPAQVFESKLWSVAKLCRGLGHHDRKRDAPDMLSIIHLAWRNCRFKGELRISTTDPSLSK